MGIELVKNGLIYQKIPAIMADLGAIGKEGKNKDQNYSFRSIESVMNHLHPVLAKHKVFVVPMATSEGARLDGHQNAKGTYVSERVTLS